MPDLKDALPIVFAVLVSTLVIGALKSAAGAETDRELWENLTAPLQ